MDTFIADWGVEFAFIRTQVGAEFSVVDTYIADPSNPQCWFFGTYGYFDLAAVRCIEHLSDPYLVLLDRGIAESAPFRFFADRDNHLKEKFEQDFASWEGAILVLAKLHASITRRDSGAARWKAARLVRNHFPEAHVFFGLGYSELLLVMGGKNLADLLKSITELRSLRDESDSSLPLFSKTTTFPLVSCAQVHKQKNYRLLEGKVEPVVTAACEPATEHQIAAEIDRETQFVRNIYGKSDLLIGWNESVSIMDLATFLTEFRQKWGPSGAVTKTSTYLESDLSPELKHPHIPIISSITAENNRFPDQMTEDEEKKLFVKLRQVKTVALRAALSDLTLRLSACLNDSQIADQFRDMANIFAYLPDLLENLDNPAPAYNAGFTAEAVADLARSAINQRYAGLELHPETLAHARAPLLCDIRTIVAAATCIPYFIFNNLYVDRTASETWSGFGPFGGSNAPQYLHQDILALPPSSLFAPIEWWWKITHEAAHGVFKTLAVHAKIPEEVRTYVDEAIRDSGLDPYHLANELFANWFDWNYIFRRDTEFYLKLIWSSWVKLPIVRKSKSQYLARSFAVFICPKLSELVPLLQQRWIDAGLPWIQARWNEFDNILRRVSGMDTYLNELTEIERQNTLSLTINTSGILHFFDKSFEATCGADKLSERLNPAYPQLNKHISMLKNGNVIVDAIPNPCRLHLELLRSLNSNEAGLAIEIAYILTLENNYLLMRNSSLKK